MTSKANNERVSPYAERAAKQEESAKKYKVVGDEACEMFAPMQHSAYRVWVEHWEKNSAKTEDSDERA